MLTGCSEDKFGVICMDSDRCTLICPMRSSSVDTNESRAVRYAGRSRRLLGRGANA